MVGENYLATKLEAVFDVFRIQQKLRVDDLGKRLAEVLPVVDVDEEETGNGNGKA